MTPRPAPAAAAGNPARPRALVAVLAAVLGLSLVIAACGSGGEGTASGSAGPNDASGETTESVPFSLALPSTSPDASTLPATDRPDPWATTTASTTTTTLPSVPEAPPDDALCATLHVIAEMVREAPLLERDVTELGRYAAEQFRTAAALLRSTGDDRLDDAVAVLESGADEIEDVDDLEEARRIGAPILTATDPTMREAIAEVIGPHAREECPDLFDGVPEA